MMVVDYLFEHFDETDIEKYCILCEQAVDSDDEEDLSTKDRDEGENSMKLQRRFYQMIYKYEDQLQCALELRDNLKCLNMHSEFGENFADKIQDVINQLQEFEQRRKEQQQFVGHTDLITEITDKLVSEELSNIGVVISALAGQGKSALGRQVCQKLEEDHDWTICKVPLRGKTTTEEMAASMLQTMAINVLSQDSNRLTEDLLAKIRDLKHNTLFFLDNCEDVMEKDKYRFGRLLHSLLETVACLDKNAPKIKFLITSRTKVSSQGLKNLASTLVQKDLGPLEEEEAVELLKMASGKEDVDQEAGEIVRECACSPLAVIMVAEVLKVGKLNPGNLVFHLKNDKKNVTSALAVGNCIDATIKLLPEEFQKELVRLSVFQSGTFSKSSAEAVVANQERVSETLEMLLDHHLIEEDNNMYSLQPLVYRYIEEWKKPKHLLKELAEANRRFVELFEGKINNIVKLYDMKCHKGIKRLEDNRQHILRFYDLLETDNDLDSWRYEVKVKSNKFVLTKKRVSDLADLLLSDAKKRRLFKREAERARKSRCDAMYIFWQVEGADLYVSLADKAGIAEEMLNTLTEGKYPSLRGLHGEKFYPALVHALFHKVKGLVWKQLRQLENAVDHLRLSLQFFEKWCNSDSFDFLKARTYSKLGQVYIAQQKYDLAEEVLTEGFRLLSKHSNAAAEFEHAANNGASNRGLAAVKPAVEDIDRLEQWDASLFHTLFGNIQLERAKQTDSSDPQREAYLVKAQQHFSKGMRLDINLKMERLDCFCEKQHGLAEVFIARGQYLEALKYAESSCDRRREIIQPPHIVFTLAVYLLAHVYQLIGNQFEKEGKQKDAHSYWTTARDYFRELEQHHLINGGIRTDHPKFAEIKYNHFCLAKSIGDDSYSKKVKKLYKDIECGHYKAVERSFLDRFKEMTLTPMETIRNLFGAGGREFGERDDVLQAFEAEAEDQYEDMMRQAEEPESGRRHDSGHGESVSSISSGSGSLSSYIGQLQLQKSTSLEDETFACPQSEPQAVKQEKFKQNKKRHKTDSTE